MQSFLQEMISRITAAKEEAIVKRSTLFPLVFFDATYIKEYLSKNGLYRALNPKLPRNVSLIDLTLSFTYEFDFWKKYHNPSAQLWVKHSRRKPKRPKSR